MYIKILACKIRKRYHLQYIDCLAMAFNALASSYIFASNKIYITAKFISPTSLGEISIDVSGNYSYYVAYRYINTNTFDASSVPYSTTPFVNTALLDNTLYTYKIYPSDSDGKIIGAAVIPTGGSSVGTICSLANPADLSLNYSGDNSSTTDVAFAYAGLGGNGYSKLTICAADSNGVTRGLIQTYGGFTPTTSYSITATTVSTYPYPRISIAPNWPSVIVSGSINVKYIFNVYVVNKDGIGNGMPVCMKSVTTCTWGTLTSAGTFVIPSKQYVIFDSNANSKKGATITGITGIFTTLLVQRSGGAGNVTIIQSTSAGNGTFCFSDLSTNLPSNTVYTYSISPVNSIGYAPTAKATTLNQTTGKSVGSICTLADPSGLIIEPIYPPNNLYVPLYNSELSTAFNVDYSTHSSYYFKLSSLDNSVSKPSFSEIWRDYDKNFDGYLYTTTPAPTYTRIWFDTQKYLRFAQYVPGSVTVYPNTILTLKVYVVNSDGLGKGMAICTQTGTCCTPAMLYRGTSDYYFRVHTVSSNGSTSTTYPQQVSGQGYGLIYPTLQNALYNNSPSYTTVTCPSGSTLVNLEGYFSTIAIQRTSPTGEVVVIPEGNTYSVGIYNTGVNLVDLSTNLLQNTVYTINIILTNAFGIKTLVGNILYAKDPNGITSKICTLSSGTFRVAPNSINVRYNVVSFDFSFNPVAGDITSHCVLYDVCNNSLQTYGNNISNTNWNISQNYTSLATGLIANVASTPNTPYTYTLYTLNRHNIGGNIPATGYTFTSWTGGKIISANLVVPNVLGRIYNSRSNSTYGNIIGNFSAVRIARSTVSSINKTAKISDIQYISSGGSAIDTDTTILPSNTIYYYSIIPVNDVGVYCDFSNNFNSAGKIQTTDSMYTLVDPSAVNTTIGPYTYTASKVYNPNQIQITMTHNKNYQYYGNGPAGAFTNKVFMINSDGSTPEVVSEYFGDIYVNAVYQGANYNISKEPTINGGGPIGYNKKYELIIAYKNTLGVYDISAGVRLSVVTFPILTYAGNFVIPDRLGMIYDSVKDATITDISGIYSYIKFTRTSWTSPQRQYGTKIIDASTNLGDNTKYTYSLTPYNSADVSSNTLTSTYYSFNTTLSGEVYTHPCTTVWSMTAYSRSTTTVSANVACSDINRGGLGMIFVNTPVDTTFGNGNVVSLNASPNNSNGASILTPDRQFKITDMGTVNYFKENTLYILDLYCIPRNYVSVYKLSSYKLMTINKGPSLTMCTLGNITSSSINLLNTATDVPTITFAGVYTSIKIFRDSRLIGNATYNGITGSTFTDLSFSDGVTKIPGLTYFSYSITPINLLGDEGLTISKNILTFQNTPDLEVKNFSNVGTTVSGNVYITKFGEAPQKTGNNICYSIYPNTATMNMFWRGLWQGYNIPYYAATTRSLGANAIATFMYYTEPGVEVTYDSMHTTGIQINGMKHSTTYTLTAYVNTPKGNTIPKSITFTTT